MMTYEKLSDWATYTFATFAFPYAFFELITDFEALVQILQMI